jgi:hypothetical protein
MSHSITAQTDATCPHCGSEFRARLWVIVDLAGSPELIPLIRDDSIHYITCLLCGRGMGKADTPLLIYRPGYKPAVLFSPAFYSTGEDIKESSTFLMERLQQSVGASWRDEGIGVVPRPRLGAVLTTNLDVVPLIETTG